MAGKKENLKSLFTNTRSRVVIIFTFILLILAIVIGFIKFRTNTSLQDASVSLGNGPGGIQSIPGAADPTAEYSSLQEEQNKSQAQQAQKSGTSAIPTIIRTQAIGEGVGVIGSNSGQTGIGFAALSRESSEGGQRSLWIQNLQNASCSKTAVQQVVNQGGQLSDLKAACSCVQLKDNGYTLQELNTVCACKDLKAAGYSARDLKNSGSYSTASLKECGFSACELHNAGFSAQQMKDGGFSDGELKGAGFSDEEIAKASGLPEGITAGDVLKAGCSVSGLNRLRSQGVSASAIRRTSGCSAEQLKSAGFSANDLRNAGFTAADLKKAGFSADALRAGGFTARDMLNAGYSPEELANAGFTNAQIKAAEAELPPGITADSVKAAACDPDNLKQEKAAGVSALIIKQQAGCSAQALKAAGFSDASLANAGFSTQELTAAKTLAAPSLDSIKAAGCEPAKLKQLMLAGVSAKQIKDTNTCSADALKNAGYDATALKNAGYTPAELIAAGFTPNELAKAGLTPADIIASGRASGCDPELLKKAKAAGVSANTIKNTLGCSVQNLKDAGYSAADLRNAGFTAAELKNAGFSAKDLKDAGFNPKELKDAGFTATELRNLGFTPAQLKSAGFSAKDLKDAGFSASQLKTAGFSPKELRDAGFSAKTLKDAGYNASQLRDAGFSAQDLKDNGFSAADLKNAGYSPKELKDAGFTSAQLKAAGLSAKNLKDAGYTAAELKRAGFTTTDLVNAGFGTEESQVAGLSPLDQTGSAFGIGAVPVNQQGNSSGQQLQAILNRQNQQMAEQKYQQKISQTSSDMAGYANQLLNDWRTVPTQVYNASAGKDDDVPRAAVVAANGGPEVTPYGPDNGQQAVPAVIKTGDILFAVMDTAVNSDEPGPILATIVSGRLKGSKLIGSFTLPPNSGKMVITFNVMSVPGAVKTTPINAYAIDPDTARTALSSKTNHHYLLRYGALFASSFLEGFGNAYQSANTSITLGGAGGSNNVTVNAGVDRSALDNAIIGLATVGKNWGQVAQQVFNTPTTVEVYAGSPVGVLFTQDIRTI